MPMYTFRCANCDASHEVISDLNTAKTLELMCFSCGADMTLAPVMALNFIGPATIAKRAEKQQEETAYFAKACGHKHACRCGVKLNRENPFRQKIRTAHGFTDEY